MTTMQVARRAGGGRPAFTAAVIIMILIVAGLFVWRVSPGAGVDQPPPVTGQP
jgi:hypothetical protein